MCSEIIFTDYHLLLSIFIVDSALLFMLTLSTTLLKVQIFWVRASRLFLERVMSPEKWFGKAEKGALLKMQEHSQADSECHYFTGCWATLVEGQKGWPCQSLSTSRINHQNFDLILIFKKQKLKKWSHLHLWRTKKHKSLPWHKETTTHNGIMTLGVTICTNVKKFVIKHSDGENCSIDWKNEARQLQSAFHREVHMINGFCFNSYFILTN